MKLKGIFKSFQSNLFYISRFFSLKYLSLSCSLNMSSQIKLMQVGNRLLMGLFILDQPLKFQCWTLKMTCNNRFLLVDRKTRTKQKHSRIRKLRAIYFRFNNGCHSGEDQSTVEAKVKKKILTKAKAAMEEGSKEECEDLAARPTSSSYEVAPSINIFLLKRLSYGRQAIL